MNIVSEMSSPASLSLVINLSALMKYSCSASSGFSCILEICDTGAKTVGDFSLLNFAFKRFHARVPSPRPSFPTQSCRISISRISSYCFQTPLLQLYEHLSAHSSERLLKLQVQRFPLLCQPVFRKFFRLNISDDPSSLCCEVFLFSRETETFHCCTVHFDTGKRSLSRLLSFENNLSVSS